MSDRLAMMVNDVKRELDAMGAHPAGPGIKKITEIAALCKDNVNNASVIIRVIMDRLVNVRHAINHHVFGYVHSSIMAFVTMLIIFFREIHTIVCLRFMALIALRRTVKEST